MLVFNCPGCGRRIHTPPQLVGQQARCPDCTCLIQLSLSATTMPCNAGLAASSSATIGNPPDGSNDSCLADDPLAATLVPESGSTDMIGLPSIPGYDILSLLGRGGMGVVYKARHTVLKRMVALKMVLAGAHATEHDLARFRSEAETLARLHHPNIVQIFEVGSHEGKPFFSLEYLDGGNLAQKVRAAPLPPRQAAEMVQQLALAMHAAHEAGIVHRDLKPGNILLTSDEQPKITDFGLAKQLDVDVGQTRSGTILGTPSYMAPEQAAGRVKEIGPLIDVYALGAILYECLTGAPPFRGPTALETLMLVTLDEPIAPSRLQPNMPADLETICLKCLEKDPRRRYHTAKDLADDLQHFLKDEPIAARPVGMLERGFKWAKRKPAVAALSLGLGLTLIVGLVLISILYVLASREGAAAEEGRREAVKAQVREKELADAAQKLAVVATEGEEREKRLGEAEKTAREQAEGDRKKAQEESVNAQRQNALLYLDRGRVQCEQGDVGQGLLSFARVLDLAPSTANDLKDAARLSLAVQLPRLPRLRACLVHDENVLRAIFSPDGNLVLTGTGAGKVQLWKTATGERIGNPLEYLGQVWALDFSPDGAMFAIGTFNSNRVHIHNSETGAHITSLEEFAHPVRSLGFGPAGKLLVVGSGSNEGGEIHVWDTATRKLKYPPIPTEAAVLSVKFRPKANTFATLDAHGMKGATVRLWDAEKGEATGKKVEFNSPVGKLRFNATGTVLYAAGGHPEHRFLDLVTDETFDVWQGGSTTLGYSGDVHPNGKTVVHGSDQFGSFYLRDPRTGRMIGRPMRHNGRTGDCTFSPNGNLVLTSCVEDRTARLWNAQTSEPVGAPLLHPAEIDQVAFAPDGWTFLTRSRDKTVRLWELSERDGAVRRHAPGGGEVVFTPDGKQAIIHRPEGAAILLTAIMDMVDKKDVLPFKMKPDHLALSPDGKTLAGGGGNFGKYRNIELWDLEKRERRYELIGHEGGISCLTFSPDGKVLASAAREPKVRLWDVETGKEVGFLGLHPAFVWGLAFAEEGKTLVTGSDEFAFLWDVKTRKKLREIRHPAEVRSLTVANDGKTLWTGGGDGIVRRWDIASGKQLQPTMSLFGSVLTLALSPDHRLLVTGTSAHEVQLWDAETGLPLGPPWRGSSELFDVKFTPNGKEYAAIGGYNGLNLFRTPVSMKGTPEQLTLQMQVLTGMELTPTGRGLALDVAAWQKRNTEWTERVKAP